MDELRETLDKVQRGIEKLDKAVRIFNASDKTITELVPVISVMITQIGWLAWAVKDMAELLPPEQPKPDRAIRLRD